VISKITLYDVDPWKVIESGLDDSTNRASESIYSLGNGRFGLRANFEEKYSGDSLLGHYVGGVYFPDKTRVGWWKNGYPETFAKVLNSTNWSKIGVMVNGVEVDLFKANHVLEFKRELDMRRGLVTRLFKVEITNGVVIKVIAERFCNMHSPNRAAIKYSIEAVSGVKQVVISPSVDADVTNEDTNWNESFWKFDQAIILDDDKVGCVVNTTNKTCFTVATAFTSSLEVNGKSLDAVSIDVSEKKVFSTYQISDIKDGDKLVLHKFIGIVSSLNNEADDLSELAISESISGRDNGYGTEFVEHCYSWEKIWNEGDVEIVGDDKAQQAIRFNIFHLNSTYRGDDPKLNIGPKGFTGEKYGGATYWDTEAYCIPFYLSTHDFSVARQLLVYRFNHLEQAIENATNLGFSGGAALYPMVTMNGDECHNEWEITFEEIHRNGAIAFAIFNYVRYTGDKRYLLEMGFDVLLGIARFWCQRVTFSESRQKWVILGVTGPNEYENNVNNNWYTNYIARWCMNYTREIGEWISSEYPDLMLAKSESWELDFSAESIQWKERCDNLYFPTLEGTQVFLQQDGFMDKEQLMVSDIPADQRPINQTWSWDRILRSVFIKQADVLQGFYFFADDFTESMLEENFDFYEPRTVHESSLSPCVHSILASRLGRLEKAYELFIQTARLDLDDFNREIHEGLHITSMAGTWMSVVEGFGGFRIVDDVPHFKPILPSEWQSYSFKVQFRGRILRVEVSHGFTEIILESGDSLNIFLNNNPLKLNLPKHC
jgi:maltose phosphorylase